MTVNNIDTLVNISDKWCAFKNETIEIVMNYLYFHIKTEHYKIGIPRNFYPELPNKNCTIDIGRTTYEVMFDQETGIENFFYNGSKKQRDLILKAIRFVDSKLNETNVVEEVILSLV